MPHQRVVMSLPERPEAGMLALAMDAREFLEKRGYIVALRYGVDGFDEDLTPIDGAEQGLGPLMMSIAGTVRL